MRVIGICGSLRAGSLNRRLLVAAGERFSAAVDFEIAGLGDVPLYDGDLDGDEKPAAVAALREHIAGASGLLLATPEYNYGIPGVLKNAIDWASRPAFDSPLTGKRCGIVSASPGAIGGARAQAQLRAVLGGTLSPVYPSVEMLVPGAKDAFDEGGALVDETAARRLDRYVEGLEAWLRG